MSDDRGPTYNPLDLDASSDCPPNFDADDTKAKSYMDNPPAVGAPKNARWGYLPCGCTNDGHGRHVYR